MSNAKRWALSTIVTFLTGFCMVLVAQIDQITPASFADGTVVGIVFAAARAGVKAVIEWYLASKANTDAGSRAYLEQQ
jgi:hypothetical protein